MPSRVTSRLLLPLSSERFTIPDGISQTAVRFCLKKLKKRDCFSRRLLQDLEERGVPEEDAAAAITFIFSALRIDENELALREVERRPLESRAALRHRLALAGAPEAELEVALNSVDDRARIRELVSGQPSRTVESHARWLLSKGFESDDVEDVLRAHAVNLSGN